MKIGMLAKFILGKNIIELMYSYYRFRQAYSDGGKDLTSAEKKHLLTIGERIIESLMSRFIFEKEKT